MVILILGVLQHGNRVKCDKTPLHKQIPAIISEEI